MGGAEGEPRVLVVEDEESVAELFVSALAPACDVERVATGGEALAALEPALDVMLLDRRMPDISGDQVLDEVEARGLDCRVAMVTAVDPDFDVIGMGFDDYLVKPVRPEELRETVDRLLALDEYEELYQELSSKRVKKNILKVEKSPDELADSDEFKALTERIEELEAELEKLESESEFDERLLPG